MRNVRLVLVSVLLLSSVAFAKPENVAVGPYKVSFDLGKVCSVVADKPESSETLQGSNITTYDISVKNNEGEAHIFISEYPDTLVDVSTDSLKKLIEGKLKGLGVANYNTYDRELDGKPGVVGFAQNPGLPTMYVATYSPDSEGNAGHITCDIISSFPLEEGTQNLLKTIHIELPTVG